MPGPAVTAAKQQQSQTSTTTTVPTTSSSAASLWRLATGKNANAAAASHSGASSTSTSRNDSGSAASLTSHDASSLASYYAAHQYAISHSSSSSSSAGSRPTSAMQGSLAKQQQQHYPNNAISSSGSTTSSHRIHNLDLTAASYRNGFDSQYSSSTSATVTPGSPRSPVTRNNSTSPAPSDNFAPLPLSIQSPTPPPILANNSRPARHAQHQPRHSLSVPPPATSAINQSVNAAGRPLLSFGPPLPTTPVNGTYAGGQLPFTRTPPRPHSPDTGPAALRTLHSRSDTAATLTQSSSHTVFKQPALPTHVSYLQQRNNLHQHGASSFSASALFGRDSPHLPSSSASHNQNLGGIPLEPTLSSTSGLSGLSGMSGLPYQYANGVSNHGGNSRSASRQSSTYGASRRPSAANLASFLEGVTHLTRVRSPSLRGHSRSGSFGELSSTASASGSGAPALTRRDSDFLHASGGGSKPWHTLDDVDEVPDWSDAHLRASTPSSPTPRRNGFFTRNPSALSLRRDELFTNEREPPGSSHTSPLPIRGMSRQARQRATHASNGHDDVLFDEEAADGEDEYAERTFVDRREGALFPRHVNFDTRQAENGYSTATPKGLWNGQASTVTLGNHVGPDGLLSPPVGFGQAQFANANHAPSELDEEDERRHLANLQEEGVDDDWSLDALFEGDRLGIGLMHEGHAIVDALDDSQASETPSQSLHSPLDDGIQFEVVRRLGYGSYAIVYLVREVLYDDTTTTEEDEYLFAASSAAPKAGPVYGREFALKCLSKADLTVEQMQVQKYEAILHRALPDHPNVVTLHKALETPAWLFLVLEYCPGQDLYFWLEQAKDTEGIDGEPSRAPSRLSSRVNVTTAASAMGKWAPSLPFDPPLGQSPAVGSFLFDENRDSTPPSPSMLAATGDNALLSRRRLRLISRMFVQMCEALQTCHDSGVSHRDIKPENIIIVDHRADEGASGKVVIKITDWGLGTTDDRCEDFDCGSKPYMAYECRNNLNPTYEPKGADVWSLGIVLLNLLFHRCPWADPTMDDADYRAYSENSVAFLEKRFDGIGSEVATFLATRVLCNIADPSKANKRVSAGEFGKWANKLVRYMGEGSRRASISESTVILQSSARLQNSPRAEGARLFHSPPTRSPRNSMEIEASPSRRPFRLPDLADHAIEELDAEQPIEDAPPAELQSAPSKLGLHSDILPDAAELEPVADVLSEAAETLELDALDIHGEPVDPRAKHRRRRGARRSKLRHSDGIAAEADDAESADGSRHHHHRSSRSRDHHVHSPIPTIDPDASLAETSQHLQAFAREISSATKRTAPVLPRSGSVDAAIPTIAAARPKSRFSDRFKGAFANGNPDLQAFAERARQRDLALSGGAQRNPTASAPAKMEEMAIASASGISSFGSVNSTGSWSEEGGAGHWASTGSRRDRVKKPEEGSSSSRGQRPSRSRASHQYPSIGHDSSTVSSSPSRHSYTPASSISSSTSYEDRSRSIGPSFAGRSPLSSIDETVYKIPGPERISADTVAEAVKSPETVCIEVITPPMFVPATSSATNSASPPAQQSNAPKAKLGRLFKTFGRG